MELSKERFDDLYCQIPDKHKESVLYYMEYLVVQRETNDEVDVTKEKIYQLIEMLDERYYQIVYDFIAFLIHSQLDEVRR